MPAPTTPARAGRPRALAAALAALLAVVPLAVAPAPAAAQAGGTEPIMGRSVLIADQIAAWFQSVGRSHRLQGVTVKQLAQLFIEEGEAEGVRGDIAFAQAIFETGYFNFSEAAPPESNNYAGIGAPNNTVFFPNPRIGVRAQIQHLRAYGDPTVATSGTAQPNVDPRFDLVKPKGVAKTFEELSGRWSGGPDYGQKIVNLYRQMRDHAGPTLRDRALGQPVVGAAVAGNGKGGTWLADRVGGVFALGAPFHGSLPQRAASGANVGHARVVAIVGSGGGNGYWLADEFGGVHAFGDAPYHGSIAQRRASGLAVGAARVVGMAATPSGDGYWLVDEIGGVHAFAGARYFGSVPERRAGGQPIGQVPIVGIASTTAGDGYWLVDGVGGIHSFGAALYHGSIPQLRAQGLTIGRAEVVALVVAPGDAGYWTIDSSGGVFAFGAAPFLGSAAGSGLRVVSGARLSGGFGYRVASADGAVVSYL